MKLLSSVLAVLIFILCCIPVSAETSDSLGLSARAAVVIEADSGRIIYAENENERLSMASTTKIMTALLAVEANDPDREIKVSGDMLKVEGTSMGLLDGDTVTLEGLICGMLLTSGNDAANVTAYTLGGSLEGFAKLMNERAGEIGMENTNFVTPSGLDAEEHYSTAYDMALLGAEAIKNEQFREYCSMSSARVEYGNPPYLRTLTGHNKMLTLYDGAFGIKTGFTKKSGRCLVSAAEREGVTLVAVTLNAPDDWNDHMKMLDYGFSQASLEQLDCDFSEYYIDVTGGKVAKVGICAHETPSAVNLGEIERNVYINSFEYAPVSTEIPVGEAVYYDEGDEIYRLKLYPAEAVESVAHVEFLTGMWSCFSFLLETMMTRT